MLVVVALGGNALLKRGQPLEATIQFANIKIAAKSIANVIRAGHQAVICHGNGPQVGLLALQSAAYKQVHAYPFDVLNAESQSMIGYMLQQALQNELKKTSVVTLITQVEVDPQDKAFLEPLKFIGPIYTKKEMDSLIKEYHWQFEKDNGNYRRVIPSPMPNNIVELTAIEVLIQKKFIVICGGGGGIPVIRKNYQLKGVEAVIDKDQTAALLALKLKADKLVILTDVAGIYENWGTADQQLIRQIEVNQLRQLSFPAGSMAPKVFAACRFVSQTGKTAAIGELAALSDIMSGKKGTEINI